MSSLQGKHNGFSSSASLDGNFEQQHLHHTGSGDQPIPKGHTFFLTKQELLEACHKVNDACHSTPQSPGTPDEAETAPGLFMPNYIHNSCSFLAAGEHNKKAKASIFEDTGLMALVCCHDCPLFVV